jgi:hypothetical protein
VQKTEIQSPTESGGGLVQDSVSHQLSVDPAIVPVVPATCASGSVVVKQGANGWTCQSVPSGAFTPGPSLVASSSNVLDVAFLPAGSGGVGTATSAARSDHDHDARYALQSSLGNYAKTSDLAGYLQASDISNSSTALGGALAALVSSSALTSALSAYETTASLTSTLSSYTTASSLSLALSNYETTSHASSTYATIASVNNTASSITSVQNDLTTANNAITALTARVAALEQVQVLRVRVTTPCTSSPCTIAYQSGSWLASVTRAGIGAYSLNVNSGTFSATPTCVCNDIGPAAGRVCNAFPTEGSTSVVNVWTSVGTGSPVPEDAAFSVICVGPK